jgi:hypothetical protein
MFPILADFLSTLGGGGVEGRYGIVHSATVSPVPACHAFFAVLAWPSVPARPPISPTLPRAVQAWKGGEEPYTTARTSCTGPSCHWPTLPRTDLPCSPSAGPALLSLPYRPGLKVRSPTAIPYRHATPCLPIPTAWPIHHKQLIT